MSALVSCQHRDSLRRVPGNNAETGTLYHLAVSGAQHNHVTGGPPGHPPNAGQNTSQGPARAAARTDPPC